MHGKSRCPGFPFDRKWNYRGATTSPTDPVGLKLLNPDRLLPEEDPFSMPVKKGLVCRCNPPEFLRVSQLQQGPMLRCKAR